MKSFYHATTRNLIATFGALFNDIEITMDETKPPYKVPLRFSNREKFLTVLNDNPDPYSKTALKQWVWMAFDMTGMHYDSERAKNTYNKIQGNTPEKIMFTRVPYTLEFALYISAKQLEHSLMILEQILPIFRPSLNVTIEEIKDFTLNTDISVTLESVSPMMEYEGAMKDQRTIFWELSFSMKAWYYCPVDEIERIKEAIVNMYLSTKGENKITNKDANKWLSEYTARVEPRYAERNDEHTIIETLREEEDE